MRFSLMMIRTYDYNLISSSRILKNNYYFKKIYSFFQTQSMNHLNKNEMKDVN